MKIALLLFGQPRNIDNLRVINSHKDNIINKYDTDVFCHAWYSEKCVYDINPDNKIYNGKIESIANAPDIIKEHYTPVSLMVDKPLDNTKYKHSRVDINREQFESDYEFNLAIKYAELYTNRSNTPIFNNSSYYGPLNANNLFSQMYSITKVCKQFDEYSKMNTIKYDFCILTRYDFFIDHLPKLNDLELNKYYIPDNHKYFPDILHIFNPMYIQANFVYDNLDKILDRFLNDKEPYDTSYNNLKSFWDFQPECIRYNSYILHFANINIRTLPIRYNRNV
jgi:hypothetical protein